MPRITMHFIDFPMGVSVTFVDAAGEQVGRSRKYADKSKLCDILKAASDPLETHQAVEFALAERPPGPVTLNLRRINSIASSLAA